MHSIYRVAKYGINMLSCKTYAYCMDSLYVFSFPSFSNGLIC